MNNKLAISFLGTGAGWPLPRLGCNCEICASKDPKDRRLRPSLLMTLPRTTVNSTSEVESSKTSEVRIVIDPGPDVYQQLAGRPKKTVQNIGCCLITHAHQDHVLGLPDLDHIYNKKGQIKLVAPASVFKDLKRNFLNLYRNLRRFGIIETESIRVGNWEIKFFPVPHSKAVSTYGISLRLTAHGVQPEKDSIPTLNTQHLTYAASYIPDSAILDPMIVELINHSRLAILDSSSWGKEGKTHTHTSIEEIIKAFGKAKELITPDGCDNTRIYLTHLGHKSGRHSDLLAKLKPYPHIQPAFDGLEIPIPLFE